MGMIVEYEKTFKYFSDFLPGVRQCIVDEMDTADRVRFTRCSRRSSREAKRSKNYIYELEMRSYSYNYYNILVRYGKKDLNFTGLIILFQKEMGKKSNRCLNSKYVDVWKEDLDISTDLFQLAGNYFKNLVELYQNSVKSISLGEFFEEFDCGNERMNRLARRAKIFKPFSSLFPELRQCIVDEMEPTDRVRFTRCSKRSSEEAKRAKNYIYGLGILIESSGNWYIQVQYGETRRFSKIIGFVMRFREINGQKFMICEMPNGRELWKKKLYTNLPKLAVEYFKQLWEKYKNRIKCATFEADAMAYYDFDIESMRRIEDLAIFGDWNIQTHVSKIQRPLKSLLIGGKNENQDLASFEQVYQVRDTFITSHKFSYEQMLRLSATNFMIHIGNLTENIIFNIIRSWQNGTNNRKNGWMRWRLNNSSFNVAELLRLLGVPHDGLERNFYQFEIKHHKEVGKMAKLTYDNFRSNKHVMFDTNPQATNFFS